VPGALTFRDREEAGQWRLRIFRKNPGKRGARTFAVSNVADAEHGFRLDLADLDEYIAGLKRALAPNVN